MRKIIDECFFQIQNGANIKQGKVDGGFPITRIETIANDRFNRDRMGYAGITDLSKYESYILEDEDLLMSHINSMQYLGRTVLYKKQDDEIIIHGMNLLRLRANRDIIIPGYAKYYFYGHSFRSQLRNIMKKSVNQASFAVKDLKKIKMEIPCLREQQKLVQVLDKIQKIIDVKTKEIAKFDELVSARFVEMFGDPIMNPKGWNVVTIKDIVTEVRYGTSKPAVEGGKYPYLRMNNLTLNGQLDLKNLKYIDIPDEEIEKCVVRKGDVLFNRTNSIDLVGKTAVFNLVEDMVIAGYIIRIRLNEKLLPEVFSQYMNLKALKDVLRAMAKGAVNQANINAQELQSIKVYLPDMDIQKQFIKIKDQIDKSKFVIHKFLYCTTHNTKSIIKPRLNTKESGKNKGRETTCRRILTF
ncbi:restriction endonuclease subunit S [Anaerostipes hadrus]|uniref:restriction endonuclease subunit S n=1 Tax=Anaerostipes hadrus TaxID=649756 RepID=UPI001ADD66D5|nr:restriction endonuclease subunit S [Anaerostipes hadrus]MBP0074471.1 restriction endonuclease subunit S [Anaerostipes hadrus]